jgi:multicomponent Na+:H+ antiporter subunit C
MMIGLYIAISRGNLVKKVMGINIFQASVILLYVSMGKVSGGTAPILIEGRTDVIYSNPLPHVLMLTAIVVGVASTALGLALVVRIKEAYETVEEDEIVALDRAEDRREMPEVLH